MKMLPCTRRLLHTLFQSSLFNPPIRHYSIKVSQPLIPGLTSRHDYSSASVSATPSSLQESQETRLQSKMEALIEDELKGATYHVDLTTKDGFLHADPRTVEAVMDSLRTTFQALTSGGDSSATEPRFPANGFLRESRSYEPLAHLLNKIIDTANRYMPRSQLSGLRFHAFGGEIKETYGSHKGLKPDGVGIIGEHPTKTKKRAKKPAKEPELSWEQIEVYVESKASVRDMVRQSGTYARCCLLGNQRRFFSLGIGFHYKNLEAYVFVFHRSGLSSSRPLKITTGEGFKGLVSHIVGILSFKGEAAYGLDITRFQNMFRINHRDYEIDRLLYVRGTLRGRSTMVYSLQATEVIPPRDLESRVLTLSGVDHIPDRLTYKQTYQIKGRFQEGPLFSQFNGQFGIGDVIGYHDCGPEDPHGSTRHLLNDAKFWRVFEQQDLPEGGRREPEERGLHCIALSAGGKALIDLRNADGGTPSPGELLESILHAIIGHYNLFDKGILHRDISSGNVLRYSEPIRRPALDKFECTRNVNYCRGFLIDGDQAIRWREFTSSPSVSGTMPFMSMRLLFSLQVRKPIIHTALDDLESFLWLLIWGIVHASKDIEGARANNQGIQFMLDAWSGNNMSKLTIAERNWEDAVFGGLIEEWLGIFRRAFDETRQFMRHMPTIPLDNKQGSEWSRACNRLESYCMKTYEDVLKSGFYHLKDVGKYSNWEEVVAAKAQAQPMIY